MELFSFILGCVAFGAIFSSVYFTNKSYRRRFRLLRAAAHAAALSRDAILELFGPDTGGLPAWIKLPDAEQSVWLNKSLEVMWPHIDQAASAWAFKDRNLETLLNSSTFWKPAWLATSGVVLQSLELGHLPPHVTGIKVYSNSASETKSRSLIADVNFEWVSKIHCIVSMKTISGVSDLSLIDRFTAFLYKAVTVKVLVKDLIARGQMRIVLAPLLGEIPVVGAIKVSFLGAPTISYNVSSFGANPLLIPGLESWLNSFIANQVLVPFTFPAGLDLNIGQAFGLAVAPPSVRPEGLLSVTVHNASGVPRMDIIGGADPYVKLFLTKKVKLRTTVQANTRSPKWEESFDFVVHDSRHQTLTLEVWDSDSLRPDEMAGRVQVDLGSLDLTMGNVNQLSLVVPRMGKNGGKGPSYEDGNGGDERLGEEGRAHGQEEREVALKKVQEHHGLNVPPGERETAHQARVLGIQHPVTTVLPGSPAKGLMPAMAKLSLGRHKQCALNISVQFFKFSSGESRAAADAQKGLQAQLSNISPRVLRLLRGGMLYINLSRAQGLSSHKGVTKTFKIKIKIGRLGASPVYKKTAERSGIGRGLSASSPVFDDDVDFLVDGDTAHAPDTVISVEIWVKHFIFKPTFKGRVVVPLARVLARGRMRDTFPLEDGSGTLYMGLEWQGVMEAM